MKCANCGKIIQPDTEGWICWRKARKYFCEQKCFDEFNLKEAAPDLLAACERLLIWRQRETPFDLLEQAGAAIAKAQGTQC